MSVRYNPPPNWPPPPPGWTPPKGWRPDPSWGPAPSGHQFWVEDISAGRRRWGEPPRGSGLAITALIVAGLALLLSWIPVVNNIALFIAVIALGFGVPALVLARRGRAGGQGMAVASVIVAGVSILVVVATQVFYVAVLEEAGRSLSGDSGPTHTTDYRKDSSQPGDLAASGDPVVPGDRADPLAPGSSSRVGREYRVTVRRVDLDADGAIARANPFNEPASGRYVLATLRVTYLGREEGDPWVDLSTVFVGTDARQYDASSCDAVTPRGVMDVPTLERGGRAAYQECFDVPPEAIDGGRLFVEESFGNADSRVFWSVPEE